MKTCLVRLDKRQRYVRRLSIGVLLQSNDKDSEYVTLSNNTIVIKTTSNDVSDYELEN